MKNPCDDCILIITCTSICDQKENYKALINHALKENVGHLKAGIPRGCKFQHYIKLNRDDETNRMKISVRKYNRKEKGNDNDPIQRQVRKILRNAKESF